MNTLQNPFHEIYLTENSSPEGFIKIFSPVLVKDALALFQSGNVVLMGIQGTGKSALLNLLKPEQRIAYTDAEDSENPFPVPEIFSKFICGGINLTRSGAIDFGQRAIEKSEELDAERVPAYFADFLNYWIVRDIYRSYAKLATHPKTCLQLGLTPPEETERLDEFARELSKKECWGNYLDGVNSLTELLTKIDYRIQQYRDFLNFNIDELDPKIQTTKTSAGIPISVFSETLRQCKLIPADLQVFVRIDQYEELDRLEDWSSSNGLFQSYKGVVNKMLGSRDPHISYRIGTRRHAWDDAPRVYGTATIIEELRNFRIIDIDELLRRKENRPWMFPGFAEDVFKRRANAFNYSVVESKKSPYISTFFGKSLNPNELARMYVKTNTVGIIRTEADWPQEYTNYLKTIAIEDPLNARLAEAWIRQKALHDGKSFKLDDWSTPKKRYWVKERREQALMQIAATKRQKLLWAGVEDVLNLSGGNILVFVSVCQYVWDAWLRTDIEQFPVALGHKTPVPSVTDIYVQDEGIQQASSYWFRKLRADPSGDSRQRFVSALASKLRDRLLSDRNMSYPGENGFSLSRKELAHVEPLVKFLNEASAFGALYDRRHTSKSRSRGESTKWYLNPILSPYFQLPVSHTKEPFYAQVSEVITLLRESNSMLFNDVMKQRASPIKNQDQQDLFGD